MNVVDSSGWLEYFADAPDAQFFASAIENVAELMQNSQKPLVCLRRAIVFSLWNS